MKKIFSILTVLAAAVFATSCSSELDKTEQQGYLKLEVSTVVSTNTRANNKPAGYAPKTIFLEVVNSAGTVVASTNDFENDNTLNNKSIALEPGTYTINAHSAGWDGTGSGFDAAYYTGSTSVTISAGTLSTANVRLTQANVTVSVIWDESIQNNFSIATSSVTSSLSGVNPMIFIMGQTTSSAHFPVSDLTFTLDVTNNDGEEFQQTNTFNDISARDHLIVTYKLADAGNEGTVNVYIDETTHTYSWTIQIPRKSNLSLTAKPANAWSNFAEVSCTAEKDASFDESCLELQYKKASDADWTDVASNLLTATAVGYSYKLTGLTPSTTYIYRFIYAKDATELKSDEIAFTTEAQTALYNGGFEDWNKDGDVWYPNASGVTYWDSSNPGSASMGEEYNVTTSTTSPVHGGSKAAKLASTYVVIKFAAASMYTGSFDHLVGTKGAVLNWGVPFASRPTSLKGYLQYAPGNVNRVGKNLPSEAPAKGSPDVCQIYCVLTTEAIQIDNTNLSTIPDWNTDPRVVAYGSLPLSQCVNSNGQWKEFNIPLEYNSLTTKPTHLIIVCSASKYGDYFHGSDSSVLYLDDFELVYGDTPTVK